MMKQLLAVPHSIVFISLLLNLSACSMNPTPETNSTAPLRHVVLFKWKESASESQIKAIEEGFAALPQKIPGIVDFEWGTDISIEGKSQEFTHCFVVTFKDEAAREVYLPHPEHKAFVALMKPSLDKVVVVDFFAGDFQGSTENDGKLRHLVLFQFKEGTTQDTLKQIEEKFVSLPSDISEIRSFEWGLNNSPEALNQGLTHCFLLTFENETGREVYLPHPSHKKFGQIVRPNVKQVLVFDYFAK